MVIRFNQIPELSFNQYHGFLQHFYKQVKAVPNKIAIVTRNNTITYYDLAKQAEILAQSLQNKGVTRETPVAILLPPGIEQVISQVGILIAKGSCVPLDRNMPEDRLNDMLEDLQVQWTIAPSLVEHKNLHTTLLDFQDLLINHQYNTNIIDDISLNHRTYILFTSGTTGKPKAVEIEAMGILRLVVNTSYINITSDDRIACIANPTFDASFFEIWGALLNGATAVIIHKKDVLNIHYFQMELVDQKITILLITAALFNLIAATEPRIFRFLRYLLVGGEVLKLHTLKLVMDIAPPQHILNAYGPTESSTIAMTHDIQPSDLTGGCVPIGRPINNTIAFILDDNMLPVSQGEVGHLYIGGDGLARGYWNRDKQNKKMFISVSIPGYSNPLRLYKTGDLCLQRADGVFMFYGRMDNQIKIRGHRIELEEIECQILKSDQVQAATVILVKIEKVDPFLAAFIVPRKMGFFKINLLNKELHQYLPEYMLPRLCVVDDIPITPNGKTDKQLLLKQLEVCIVKTVRPDTFNDTEYSLLMIWRKILNINDISLDDNFFHLGGNSLQAASFIIELERQFMQRFSMQTLYGAPTLRELAYVISNKNEIQEPDNVTQFLHDAQLPDNIQPLTAEPQNWSILKDASPLLTGVTGFLGSYFLRDLLALSNIKKVICLIRATDEMAARQRIKHNLSQYGLWSPIFNERITIIIGDLSLPKLGLSDELYHQLAIEIDVIFHLGAHVNYIEPYQAHRACNIEGTLNILHLATQRKSKQLHYISTIAAFGPAGLSNKINRIYENDDLMPYLEGMKYDSGYSQSQWVVEQFIWEAKKRGIPLSVYRPGFIMGDSVNGMGNPKDFISRLVSGCVAIGAYPNLPHQRKEFVQVDHVSAAIITIAKDNNNLGQAYHLIPFNHKQSINLNQFFTMICECGYPLEKVSYNEWVTRLYNDPNLYENPLMSLLPMLSETVHQKQTRWEVYENMPAYDASNTQAALVAANSQLKFTRIDKNQISLYLNFWKKCGLLPDCKN